VITVQKEVIKRKFEMKIKKTVALFDFDGTLIRVDSFPRFLWFYTAPLKFLQKSLCSIPVLLKYAFGLVDNHTAKEKIFMIFFEGTKKNEFIKKAKLFSEFIIPHFVRDEAVSKLQLHLKQKHQCILVSASIEDYLTSWAEGAGFSKLLATRMEVDDNGNLTGKFAGRNCEGPEKVRRLKETLGALEEYEIYAYGDSKGDKNLLEIAEHQFYKSFKKERRYPD